MLNVLSEGGRLRYTGFGIEVDELWWELGYEITILFYFKWRGFVLFI